jgi:hypothetical protein
MCSTDRIESGFRIQTREFLSKVTLFSRADAYPKFLIASRLGQKAVTIFLARTLGYLRGNFVP